LGGLIKEKTKGFETRKVIFPVTLAVFLVVSAAFAGCGGSNNTNTGEKSSVTTISEAELGVPIYPGATKQDISEGMPREGSGTIGPPPRNGRSDSSAFQPPGNQSGTNGPNPMRGLGDMTMLWTPDSAEEVSAWYREQLSGKTGFEEVTPPGLRGSEESSTSVMYTFKSGDTTKIVMVRENRVNDKGGTSITIGDRPDGMPAASPGNQSQ
jgi:hypothetical protein